MPFTAVDELIRMSDTPIVRELRLLPSGPPADDADDQTTPRTNASPTPDATTEPDGPVSEFFEPDESIVNPLPGDEHFVHDPPPDDGLFLRRVLTQRKTFPTGAKVGDGTPGPGRKPIEIDDRVVMAMATVGATLGEIADFVGVSHDVIEARFAAQIRTAKAGRKLRLRQAQWAAALEGNPTMLIWLGKNELGQYDESRIKVGDLTQYSDAELEQLAQGKVPGQLHAGRKSKEDDDR